MPVKFKILTTPLLNFFSQRRQIVYCTSAVTHSVLPFSWVVHPEVFVFAQVYSAIYCINLRMPSSVIS